MLDITCKKCGISFSTALDIIKHKNVSCPVCGHIFKYGFLAEDITNPHGFEVLKKGDIVRIINTEHVWYDQIGLICDVKNLFYRIEMFGNKTWIPQHWVKIDEPDDIN